MSSYATQTELENYIGGATQLARLTADSGSTPNATVVAQELGCGQGEADSYLSRRIKTPVDFTLYPALESWLKGIVLAIVARRCWHRRQIKIPSVEEAYKDAVRQLADFAAGTTAAPGDTAPAASVTDAPATVWGYEEAKATADLMVGL